MIDRLFKSGIATTMLGVVFMGIAAYLYISKDHNEIEAGAVAALGVMFLRSKDSLIGIPSKDESEK